MLSKTNTTRIVLVVYLIFLWGMPWWARISNDIAGNWKPSFGGNRVCTIPVKDLGCNTFWLEITGFDWDDIAKDRKKKWGRDDNNVGCGCGQGVFGEDICPLSQTFGMTLSNYISAAPAGCAFASMTGFLILAQYDVLAHVLIVFQASPCEKRATYVTLSLFVLTFIWFVFSTYCVFPFNHSSTTFLFVASLAIHQLVVSVIMLKHAETRKARVLGFLLLADVAFGAIMCLICFYNPFHLFWTMASAFDMKGFYFFFYIEVMMVSSLVGWGPFMQCFFEYNPYAEDASAHAEEEVQLSLVPLAPRTPMTSAAS